MRAMILAAGRGSRLRPMTDHTAKALLPIKNKPLIEHHLERLSRAGITEVVINLSYKGDQIRSVLGNGDRFNLNIHYSPEKSGGLETGGGILKALPLLGEENFLVLNADIYTEIDFSLLPEEIPGLAHLLFVPNPKHNPLGDFCLDNGEVSKTGGELYTFSGVGVYSTKLFAGDLPEYFPLRDVLFPAIDKGQVTGSLYQGLWIDVGTPERLRMAQGFGS